MREMKRAFETILLPFEGTTTPDTLRMPKDWSVKLDAKIHRHQIHSVAGYYITPRGYRGVSKGI